MIPPRERRIDLQHLSLAAREWGPAEGDPIIALHGWLDNAASFEPLAAALPERRLLAVDLPGHGRSDHYPMGATQFFLDYPGIVLELLDSLTLGSAEFIGHSMGAGILSLLAGAFPERVRKLVLIEGLGPLSDLPASAPTRLRDSILMHRQRPARSATRSAIYRDLDHAVRARRMAGRLSDAAARLLVERNLKPAPGGFVFRSDPRLKQPSLYRMTEEQVGAFLAAIESAVLLISGAESEFQEMWPMFRKRVGLVANLRSVILPGGHHVHMDAPEACAAAIREFLQA